MSERSKPQVAETVLSVPQGEFQLQRLPRRRNEVLRAWDAADELLLSKLDEQALLSDRRRVLIVNDAFGALALGLHAYSPLAWSDSWLSQMATRMNLEENSLPSESITLLGSLDALPGEFDLVLIKVPKTLALLEEQLIRLRPHLAQGSRVIVAGMVKGMPSSVWQLLERLLGPTSTSRAWKKARLIEVGPDQSLPLPQSPYPVRYRLEGTDYTISNHANVFSRDRLDIGTRFFLQHLPRLESAKDIVDLGCGNGVLGLMAAQQHPQATVHFIDESHMAVASARENFEAAFGDTRRARFVVGDGLQDYPPASADLVLCNPPFHQANTVGDQIAERMFNQTRKALREGGELWVIGNRHLGYHVSLDRRFHDVELVASNRKFVILRARD